MAPLKSYRELEVWKLSMELAVKAYELSERFKPQDRYGLASQFTRSASSIAANIAEGYGRMSRPDYIRFLTIARGSLTEFETHLILAVRIGRFEREETREIWELSQIVSRYLRKLILALKRKEKANVRRVVE